MFQKSDLKFAEYAVDPERRQRTISSYRTTRGLLFWCATLISIICLAEVIYGRPAGTGLGISCVIQWMLVFRFDTDVRLLTIVDQLSAKKTDQN